MPKYKNEQDAFNDLCQCPDRLYTDDGRVIMISSWKPIGSINNIHKNGIIVSIDGYIEREECSD